MASPLYTMDPRSPSILSSILPNISLSRTISSPYTRPHNPIFTASPPSSPPAPTRTTSNRKRTGSPKRIARPVNAFLLFRSAFLKESRIPAYEENRQQNLSKVVGQCWNAMPPAERAVWYAKAAEAKRVHTAMYPNYKFSPRRAASGGRRVSEPKRARDEVAEKEMEDAVREMRERWTHYKGEPVLSNRNEKKLARSVRGTERASARPSSKKAAKSTSASTPTPAPSATTTTSTNTNDSSSSTFPVTPSSCAAPSSPSIFSTLLSPLPLRLPFAQLASFLPPPTPFLPSTTHLAPAPSAGPQITRIRQSPPLMPFHLSDRQPQLQLQHAQHTQHADAQQQQIQAPRLSFPLYEPCAVPAPDWPQWGLHQARPGCGTGMEGAFDAFGAPIYPAMGLFETYATPTTMPHASAYFDPDGAQAAQVTNDVDMGMYLNFDDVGLDVDYSSFADAYTGVGLSSEAPTTYAPAVSPPSSESSSSSDMTSPASLAYPDSPVTPTTFASGSASGFVSGSGSSSGSGYGSPASLVYPDTPASASGSPDSPDALVYPFRVPNPDATYEITLAAPYGAPSCADADAYTHTHTYAYGNTYPDHGAYYSWSDPANGLQVELGNAGCF